MCVKNYFVKGNEKYHRLENAVEEVSIGRRCFP